MSLLSRSKFPFPKLQVLDVSHNEFLGSLPQIYINNFIALIEPVEIEDYEFLSLTGHIPSSLENLSEFESLDLSTNKLDGEIPSELTKLKFLAKLNLSVNNLVGEIPRSNQFFIFENDSYMGNLGLCGLPLTRKCKEDDGKSIQLAKEEDDENGFIDGFGWRYVVMGYGSGFVVGIGIGYMIIRSGRPRWLVEFIFGVGYQYKPKKRSNRAAPTRRVT
ncbi:receptor-like protein 9DC3 [Salvia hispanica]|uniref:receptor-like protein 9DC3 n=1 Tax=Salvia hispanica TaxID=49212 RepID=UPI0020097910|nr:receptor-like protein 9DC3 [Salvia hispanica]